MKLVVEERVGRLGEAGREVLTQAAVLGRVSGRGEDDLFEVLDRAVAARLLADRTTAGEERYGFADDQVQEVLYAGLTAPRRRRYHRQAGEAIEALYPDRLDDHLEELARHFVAGNEPAKGAEYAYRAGLKNDRLFNWSRSAELYRLALRLWEDLGGYVEQRAAVYEKLGDVSYRSSLNASEAIGYLQGALSLYEELGNQRKRAIIHSQIGREYYSGANLRLHDLDAAPEHLNLAQMILEREPVSLALGWVYNILAYAYIARLEWTTCLIYAKKSAEVAERFNNSALIAHAHHARGDWINPHWGCRLGIHSLRRVLAPVLAPQRRLVGRWRPAFWDLDSGAAQGPASRIGLGSPPAGLSDHEFRPLSAGGGCGVPRAAR